MITPNKAVDRVDRAFYNIANWSINHRLGITIITLVLFATGLYFAGKVKFDAGSDSFFNKSDPAYSAYIEYTEDFTSDEVVYLMYGANDIEHGPFNLNVMRTIAKLTEVLELEVPFVRKVTSLANVEFMRPVGEDDIEIDKLLIDFPETQQALLDIREAVLEKPIYINYLVNKKADHAAIIVQMSVSTADDPDDIIFDKSQPASVTNSYPTVSNSAIKKILARPEFADQGIDFYLSGDVPMNSSYIAIMANDTAKITVVALILIVLLCMVMFRATLASILGPIAVVLTSVTLTVGLMGIFGWKITNFFALLPTLICAVGIAQSVHLLLEFQRQLSLTGDRNEAVKSAFAKVGGPCLLAALTTATGFVAMSATELKAISQFAIYASFGILATFVFSTTLLVIFLAGKPRKNDHKKVGKSSINPMVIPLVEKSIAINLKHPALVLWVFGLVFITAFIGITQLRNDFSFLYDFKPHVEWRADTEKIEKEMGGVVSVSYLIDTQVPDGVKNPTLLKQIEQIQKFVEQKPIVKKTQSLADVVKDLNQTFHGNDETYYNIPDRQDLLAQYFLVYEMSGGKELEEFVSYDFSRTVIEFQVEMNYASDIKKLLEELDQYVEENPFTNAQGQQTGMGLLWVKITEYIGDTQIVSYTLVFSIITILMCLSFGSIKVGLLSMIPNLTPVVLALGALGWTGVPLDYLKLLLATIAIGIAVDDTIHLVTRFRARFYETGNYQQALTLGLRDVGPALVVTSSILIVAFAAYLLSSTVILTHFGLLLGGTIGAALLADLFLMPVLLLVVKPFGAEFEPKKHPANGNT